MPASTIRVPHPTPATRPAAHTTHPPAQPHTQPHTHTQPQPHTQAQLHAHAQAQAPAPAPAPAQPHTQTPAPLPAPAHTPAQAASPHTQTPTQVQDPSPARIQIPSQTRAPHHRTPPPQNQTHPQDQTHRQDQTHGRPARGPSLTTTVPTEYVHRASIAEVLLTGWHRTSDHHFTVTAQWPRSHPFYTPINGHHDPLIAAETIRQAGILLAHTEYHVPLDTHLLLTHLNVTTHPEHTRIGPTPANLQLHITYTNIKQRRNTLTHATIHVTITRNGHTAATGNGTFTCITPTIYTRLRTPHLTPHQPTTPDIASTPHTPGTLPTTTPVPPHTVQRTHPHDVVLTPHTPHTNTETETGAETGAETETTGTRATDPTATTGTSTTQTTGTPEATAAGPHTTTRSWLLRLNTSHPTLFDHPQDHVPGMLLLEAARQATHATHHTNDTETGTHTDTSTSTSTGTGTGTGTGMDTGTGTDTGMDTSQHPMGTDTSQPAYTHLPTTITTHYTQYTELHTPTTITTTTTHPRNNNTDGGNTSNSDTGRPATRTTHITAHQNGTPTFHATITTTPTPTHHP
ncbi:ScbA/BarX family gamma-butyrolactone biosynthesis protein [Streptomyces sp. NPDC050535]|uniref:ScbA/BarX family gamma-butyrolactone biosynthesis protein n=1 Tax=Streptomyces sp. NPDC050535 TaxID=3365626 RepID=UPI00378DA905